MKKYMSILLTIIMIAMMLVSVSTTVFAGGWATDITGPTKDETKAADVTGKVNTVLANALWLAQLIGYGVATIILVVLAIKYLMASPNERAEIKKSATIWVVGAVILFAGSGILTVISNFSTNIKV